MYSLVTLLWSNGQVGEGFNIPPISSVTSKLKHDPVLQIEG